MKPFKKSNVYITNISKIWYIKYGVEYMKKLIVAMLGVFLMAACTAQGKTVEKESTNEKMFNLMVEAKKENRDLTEKESQTLNDFYMNKPLDERGDELDYSLSQMFFNFNNDKAFEEFKDKAEKILK